jgi:DNA modification methylase
MTQAGILHKQTLIWVKNSAVMSRQDYHWRHEPCLYGWKAGAAHRWCGNRKQNTVLEDGRAVVVEQDPKGHGQIISFTDGVRTCQIRVPEYEVLFDGTDDMTTIWKVDRPTKNLDHPTMKPVEVVLRALRNSTKVGDKVTDFFLGSGTTLMGCEMLDRVCYGSEKDPVYCDVILRRWEEYTGRKAEKAQG